MHLFRRFVAASEADNRNGGANLQSYLSLWFQGVRCDEIRRGNMEELMAYGGWRLGGGGWFGYVARSESVVSSASAAHALLHYALLLAAPIT